jgi:flagellar motility protein MotE (MotC chaperone)
VQLEQDEMKLLREAMERRLKARMLTRERKLSQLARRCEALEAGEAVQILVALEDSDLGQVLERMDRAKALQVAALLDRLGRGKAISLK